MSIADEIAKMVGDGGGSQANRAKVLRTDPDGTVWVSIAGGAGETPLSGTFVECEPGDLVDVAISGGVAVATANRTSPASTVRSVQEVEEQVGVASERIGFMQTDVDLASQAAAEAKAVAEATGQHFWEDSNGAHVTEITKEDWQAEEAKPNPFADVSDAKPYHNLLMNSLGILLRTALKNLVSITRSAIAFFDGQGNAAANVTASFGKDGFQVGVTGESHMVGDYHSLELMDKEGVGYFHVSDLRDRTGSVEVTETFAGDGTTTQFTISLSPDPSLTTLDVKVDGTSVANSVIRQKVFLTSAPAYGASVAITYTTEDNLAKAYTFGIRSDNHPVAPMSYAFGDDVAATMPFAYVEGDGTRAYGYASHAEGCGTVARGGHSHAEGYHTEAGPYAHAEGLACVASGPCSHANGRETVAASNHQTAIGHYNVEDANGDYALIIGNGTSDSNRSNAMTVGWDGSVNAAGDLTAANIGDVVNASKGATSTATSAYVDLTSFELDAGTWMVFATFEFATNATNRRVAMLNTTPGGNGISLQWRATESGVAGGPTRPKFAGVLTPTATTTYYLTSWQNSGGALNVSCACQAVRIR